MNFFVKSKMIITLNWRVTPQNRRICFFGMNGVVFPMCISDAGSDSLHLQTTITGLSYLVLSYLYCRNAVIFVANVLPFGMNIMMCVNISCYMNLATLIIL